jgi:hypothetical protein
MRNAQEVDKHSAPEPVAIVSELAPQGRWQRLSSELSSFVMIARTPRQRATFLLNLISVHRGTTIRHTRPFVIAPWLQVRCAAETKPTYSTGNA